MASGKSGRRQNAGTTQQIISTAMGAAQALTVGMVHLAGRTFTEALRAAEGVGTEIGSAVARATRGSRQAASDIRGDLGNLGRRTAGTPSAPERKPLAKVRTRRRRRRGAA